MSNPLKRWLFGALLCASPLSAQTVLLHDTFDTENGGSASVVPYAGFANWTVPTGYTVDLVKSGEYGITCSGMCVDLDGTPGPGAIMSKLSYSFAAGDVVRFRALISGSQRSSAVDNLSLYLYFTTPVDLSNLTYVERGVASNVGPFANLPSAVLTSNVGGTEKFAWYGWEFTAATAGSVSIGLGSESRDNIGPLVDEVHLERTSVAVPEPSGLMLLIAGAAALGVVARRRERR